VELDDTWRTRMALIGWRTPLIVLAFALIVVFGMFYWWVLQRSAEVSECSQGYSRAVDAADTTAVDRLVVHNPNPRQDVGKVTCGALRRAGQLPERPRTE